MERRAKDVEIPDDVLGLFAKARLGRAGISIPLPAKVLRRLRFFGRRYRTQSIVELSEYVSVDPVVMGNKYTFAAIVMEHICGEYGTFEAFDYERGAHIATLRELQDATRPWADDDTGISPRGRRLFLAAVRYAICDEPKRAEQAIRRVAVLEGWPTLTAARRIDTSPSAGSCT